MKNKKVAALLSLLFPGLGHLYIGKYVDGVSWMIGAMGLWYIALFIKGDARGGSQVLNFSSPRAYIFWIGFVLIYLYVIFDAYRKANKKQLKNNL